MKYLLALLVTVFLGAGAWMGYSIRNDFIFYLFALLTLAPGTAIVAGKARVA
ncbi:MAG: hypothetical protein BroJett021_33290 [Chloroflexota bacterium]|nr:MAG: hypothetical protein BroJett021_33290 [Chloroflexota bacterium]